MKNKKRTALTLVGVILAIVLAVVVWRMDPGHSPLGPGEKTCTVAIRCDTVLDNLDSLDPDKAELIPANGALLDKTEVAFSEGESAIDVLKRVCQDQGVHLELSTTPGYGSIYVKAVGNLYEFDCGERSGWLYQVNGQVLEVAASEYTLQEGDAVEFLYSCAWGEDLG